MKAGWKTVKLGEASELLADGDWIESKDQSNDGIRLIQTGNIGDGIFKDREEKARYISESTFKRLRCTEIVEGDCLISRLPEPVGRSCILPSIPRSITAVDCAIIRFKQSLILPEYFCYFSQSRAYQRLVESKTSGTTRKRISRSHLAEIEIPLPPLAEQKRIVALLDEAFAGIAEAKSTAEESINRIHALFESHLQAIFTQRGPGWVERRLGEVSRINYGYTESASAEMIGPHFLRITDIQDEGVDWSTVPYCRIDKDDLPKYKLSDGDIVFARTGATTGKSYLVSNPPDSVFASYLIRVQLSEKALLPGFLYLFFQTRSYWDVIRAGVSGSAQGGFNASKLGELTVAYPVSLSDQNILIRSISDIQAVTLMAGKLVKEKLQALAELKASILAQAFAGEITA